MKRYLSWALAPLAVLSLAACGGDDGKSDGAAEPSSATLAATLKGDRSFGTLEQVLTNAGLIEVLEGTGPYTVFAPADAAFTTAGSDADFTTEAMRAPAAALLRAHIVPGALTRADIGAAIDGGGTGTIQMRTMADTLLSFTRDGDAIVVTAPDGARAHLTGSEELVKNGVVQPIDALLIKPAPAT
ncbi:fasciclin domain-containing protein [uncultured Brevundimonas sp.]|uniref:fasciclin domain-containing protein n=1 Tax=uncultured Brevundimonas sp. TaxID=213418 RepID=UPI0030EDF46B|tara:strand:+ start:1757 stop:2314 length:558 start_codon:yes stop_codon:yes gene_type:complete